MKCPACLKDNRKGAKFCNSCGHKLELTCPQCNNLYHPESKYCDECGFNLSNSYLSHGPLSPSPSPKKSCYAPKLESLPEGERRQVTIVFSDLSGYTAMNEQLDPEEVERVMSRIKEESVRIVERYGGIVNQFVGDEVLALFGIPMAHEDDPFRAVKAAMELHEMVRNISPEIEDRIRKPLKLHTGISTGLVVTSLRDDRNGLYGITGDAVNTGARLKSISGLDEILVSPETHRQIAPYFETIALRKVRMKGKTKSIIPFRVLKETKIHSRIEAAEKRGFTNYTGRDQELALLNNCLDKVLQGKGQFVTVLGEAGVGKSRLHYEFRHRLDREKVTVLQGRCQPIGVDIPYLPFIDSLRRGLNLREEDRPVDLLDKAVTNVLGIDPSLEQFLPLYLHLLSIQSDYQLPDHLQGNEFQKAMEKALAAIMIQNTQHRPMVLILEDWHWSDDASRAALKYLIGTIAPYSLLLMVTYRPVYQANWGYVSYHTPILLKSLDIPNTQNIIKSVIVATELPKGLGELIHDRTGGNPLFIEEMCYSLIEEKLLVVRDGQVTLTRSLVDLRLPDSIQAIIRTRLDRLESNSRETLRLASAIGRVFSQRILERIHSAQAALSESLELLKALELIQQIRVLPEAEFSFKHALTQNVVYETLLHKRRKELHGAIAKVIEELYSERLEEHESILAYHYARSNCHEKAIKYAFLAGDKAASLYANTEARNYYHQAFVVSENLPVSSNSKQWQIDAALKLAAVGITRQDIEQNQDYLEKARFLAEEVKDKARLAKVLYWLGRINYVLWNPEIAIEFARQSLKIADVIGDDAITAAPVNLMGRVYYQLSDFVKASQMMERSVEQMRRIGNKTEESTASAFAGYLLAFLGEFERALVHTKYGIQLANKVQNPFTVANAYHLRGCVFDQLGEWTQAIANYEKAIQIADEAEDLFRLYLVKSWKGRAYSMLKKPDKGQELLEESLCLAESIGTKFWLAWQKTALSYCLLMLGNLDLGYQYCQEAIRLGEETNDIFVIAYANRTLAEICSTLKPSDHQLIDRLMLKAIELQRDINVIPELARSYACFSRLLIMRNNQIRAEDYLEKAVSLFREMQMFWDLSQIEQS